MVGRRKLLTVIVIPQTGKRPFSFRVGPIWTLLVLTIAVIAGVLVARMADTINRLTETNEALASGLVEFEDLKRVNRIQRAEIDAMSLKAQEAQEKLELLQDLEDQINELTGKTSTSKVSRGDAEHAIATDLRGRGGPKVPSTAIENLPTLTAMLPVDVTGHIFARRDTLPLHLLQISTYNPDSPTTLAQAEATSSLMDLQLWELDSLMDSLMQGKEAIVDQLDYLAHKPSGYPVSGALLTDRFGWRSNPFGGGRQFHSGLDLAQDYWTPIAASGEGVVTYAGWKSGGYGYTVIVDHGYGFQTLYGHMVDWDVKVGQKVVRGTRLGWVGSTGNSTGPHLHYEVYVNGVAVDPIKYLQ